MVKIMTSTPRMRTRDQAIALLKREDPDTNLTRNSIQYLIASGKLPTVKIGNKILLNYDLLLDIVANGFEAEDEPQEPGSIRRIDI